MNTAGVRLDGFRVGVTSDRKASELIEALERRGAEVMHAPTIRMTAARDPALLDAETAAIVASRPAVLLATTSYGVRRWFDAADEAGAGAALAACLRDAEILVRGPKARGAVRSLGLDDQGMGAAETTEALVDLAIERGVRGRTVAVQLHGAPNRRELERLRAAGAEVLTVSPYAWSEHDDQPRVRRLIDAAVTGALDAITFTSAPAASALFRAAEEAGADVALFAALRTAPGAGGVTAAVVGPVAAQPFLERGVSPVVPQRFRVGALIRVLCDHLASAHTLRAETAAGPLELRGRTIEIDGRSACLSPTALALARELIAARGAIVSRDALARAAHASTDGVSIDMAVSRLRASLPSPDIVQTVVKRGYRLRVTESTTLPAAPSRATAPR